MRVLDLFSGIGGFSLGLERAGMRTVAFCEIDPFCREVLRKHWSDIPCYDDVRTLTAARLAADGVGVDVICGGFPCQDISLAGKGAGLAGARSGLWAEYARLVGELRPIYVIVENVAALLARGFDQVLGDLASLGYDAEWHSIPAAAVGAPHRRDRLWIVAYAGGGELRHQPGWCGRACWSDPTFLGDNGEEGPMADTESVARQLSAEERQALSDAGGRGADVANADGARLEIGIERNTGKRSASLGGSWWCSEPDVGRVAHGIPARVDRLRALGNAVVPQIPEIIGRAIMTAQR